MKYKILFFVVFVFSLQAWGQRIEVGDDISRIETSTGGHGTSFRANNRIGAGLSFMGAAGTAGMNMEINFSPSWGLIAGLGTNSDFQSFYIEYKKILTGDSFVPYGVLGISRWQGSQDSPIYKTDPDFLAEDFMSSKDRRQGKISETLLYPGIGIQYIQLGGDWRGFSVFAQLNIFMDVIDLAVAPRLGFGSTYYF